MLPIRLALIGCGGMGIRHLYGLAELQRAGLSTFDLVAACDPVAENASALADSARELLGRRPATYARLEDLPPDSVDAVDIPASPRVHHTLAAAALARGWHVMVEKPMGLTVRAAQQIVQAADASQGVLSVAENYRRDPVNRLARALLQQGVIGRPRFVFHQTVGGGNRMLISVWRHQKDQSGILLDVGVHFMDVLEYLLGEIEQVYAQTRLHEPIRHNPAVENIGPLSDPGGVYARWQRVMPAQFQATAEDAAYATLIFRSGTVGQYVEDHAGHGQGIWLRRIHGSAGSLDLPNDRTGHPIRLTTADGDTRQGVELLTLVPDFRLDEITAALFGGHRLAQYDLPFVEVDRKLIAVEYGEFANAIRTGAAPEVGAMQGLRAVAGSYALLESGQCGAPVTLEDVITGRVDAYQREIDRGLGFLQ